MASNPTKQLVIIAPGATIDWIEDSPSLLVFPERTRHIAATAKHALQETVQVRKVIEEIYQGDTQPFA